MHHLGAFYGPGVLGYTAHACFGVGDTASAGCTARARHTTRAGHTARASRTAHAARARHTARARHAANTRVIYILRCVLDASSAPEQN